MLELYPVDEGSSDDIKDTDTAVGRAVDKPFALRSREADIIDLVGSSVLEVAHSFEACLRVQYRH